MLENKRTIQAIVTDQEEMGLDRYTQKIALFKEDKTPFNPFSANGPAPMSVTLPVTTSVPLTAANQYSWQDADTSGTPAARQLDLIWYGVEPGQIVEVVPNFISAATTGVFYLDMFTIVNGVGVSRFGYDEPGSDGPPYNGSDYPNSSWSLGVSTYQHIQNPRTYTVKAEDLNADGILRCRLRKFYFSGAARSITSQFGIEARLTGHGPYDKRRGALFVFDGQSHNQASSPNTFPALSMVGVPAPFMVSAISGTSWTDLTPSVKPRVHVHAKVYERPILVLTGGTSDLMASDDNDTGEQALADMEEYADNARAAGFKHIIGSTMTKTPFLDVDGEAQRLIYNEGIRNSDHWEQVVDWVKVPELNNNLNTTYFYDQTHLTAAGNAKVAEIMRPALLAALG